MKNPLSLGFGVHRADAPKRAARRCFGPCVGIWGMRVKIFLGVGVRGWGVGFKVEGFGFGV